MDTSGLRSNICLDCNWFRRGVKVYTLKRDGVFKMKALCPSCRDEYMNDGYTVKDTEEEE